MAVKSVFPRARFWAATVVAILAAIATALSPAVALASPAGGVLGPWTSQHVPKGLDHLILHYVSCSGTGKVCETGGSFCTPGGCGGLIPGGVLVTANGGASWSKSSLPANIGDLAGIVCSSATRCIVLAVKGPLGPHLAQVFLVTSNAGKSWAVVKPPSGVSPNGMACLSATHCIAVGFAGSKGAIVGTTNGGKTWKSLHVPTGISYVSEISCGSASQCVATAVGASGLDFVYTKNGGTSWTKAPAPSAMGNFTSISCPSSAKCFAAGVNSARTAGEIAVTSDGGAKWTAKSVTAGGVTAVTDISCQTTSRCAAVASSNKTSRIIIATTNGGAKWSTDRLPAGQGDLEAITCTNTGHCLAVGDFFTIKNGNITDNGPLILAG